MQTKAKTRATRNKKAAPATTAPASAIDTSLAPLDSSVAPASAENTESVASIHADLIATMQRRGLVATSPQFHTDSDKANVKLAISGHRDNASGRTMRDRSLNLYIAARDTYGDNLFRARGLDNSIIAMLCANGYFAIASGGERYTDANNSGVTRLRDAPDSPVLLRVIPRTKA